MISPIRKEILSVLAELSEIVPEVRLGQLMANLSYLARGFSKEAIWDMEDDELLQSARKHLEQWRSSPVSKSEPESKSRSIQAI